MQQEINRMTRIYEGIGSLLKKCTVEPNAVAYGVTAFPAFVRKELGNKMDKIDVYSDSVNTLVKIYARVKAQAIRLEKWQEFIDKDQKMKHKRMTLLNKGDELGLHLITELKVTKDFIEDTEKDVKDISASIKKLRFLGMKDDLTDYDRFTNNVDAVVDAAIKRWEADLRKNAVPDSVALERHIESGRCKSGCIKGPTVQKSNGSTKHLVKFRKHFKSTNYEVIMGFTRLDTFQGANQRINVTVQSKKKESMELLIATWGDSICYSVCVDWLAYE